MAALGISGGASSALGSVANLLSSKMLMKYQYKLNRKMRRVAYQDTMRDMELAGLNPILAYQRGPTAGAGAVSLAASPQFGQIGAGIAAGAQAGAAQKQAGAAQRQAKTAGSLRREQEAAARAQTLKFIADAGLANTSAQGVANQNVISKEQAEWALTDAGKAAIHGKMVGGGPIGTAAGVALDMGLQSLKGPPRSPFRYDKPIVIHSNPGGRPGGKK